MIDESMKKILIKSIKDIGVDDPIVEAAEKFINRYDGNDEEYLKLLCFAITGVLFKIKRLQVKADAYEQVNLLRDYANDEIEEIKEMFEQLNSGVLPSEPAVSNPPQIESQ